MEPGTPVPPVQGKLTKEQLISTVFEYMLGRKPSLEERKLANAALGSNSARIKSEGLADLLWAIAMQPEFQLIY